MGEALFTGNETGLVNLVYDAPDDALEFDGYCESLSKNDTWLAGNVVLCFSEDGDFVDAEDIQATVKEAGASGVIISQQKMSALYSYKGDFPSVQVDYVVGSKILLHIRSTRNPRVRIHPTKTQIGKPISSTISFYSSRGPNTLAPEILKPDIAAPGTNILAAYISEDPAVPSAYDFLSGTSMATPHVAGIVALLKAAHPKWSPSAIKSAIVTTAWTTDPSSGEPIFSEGETNTKLADAFDYGGGIIHPNRAQNPGLVYDMGTTDYLHCLCAMGYNSTAISQLAGQTINCPKGFSILDVNFPSITIQDLKHSVTLKRTVTNVGPTNSSYKLIVERPRGIRVSVNPDTLIFTPNVTKITFVVTISTSYSYNTGYYFGSLTWNDGCHNVRIPISVNTLS
ncbi:unnamed protein product [Cuscuta europaea]|uniref:Uncharacterized protein n=1 Tax=Cuscuta europaea TaxID=41803 RepID=A0A9P0ZQW7_CUSEU|nr:unnamed protein product [Cuscuta europaea]